MNSGAEAIISVLALVKKYLCAALVKWLLMIDKLCGTLDWGSRVRWILK